MAWAFAALPLAALLRVGILLVPACAKGQLTLYQWVVGLLMFAGLRLSALGFYVIFSVVASLLADTEADESATHNLLGLAVLMPLLMWGAQLCGLIEPIPTLGDDLWPPMGEDDIPW